MSTLKAFCILLNGGAALLNFAIAAINIHNENYHLLLMNLPAAILSTGVVVFLWVKMK